MAIMLTIKQSPSNEDLDNARQEQERQQQDLFKVVLTTIQHFFGPFSKWLIGVEDPRASNINYPIGSMLFAGIWTFLCQLESRRQIGLKLRNGPSQVNFQTLFGIEGFPHGDTLNGLYRKLEPEQVQEIICTLIEILIRKKLLYPYRLFGQYFVIAIDGTGIVTYHKRHCPHCLTRKTRKGETLYYHNVLEAKLVTRTGFCFSIMTEFIENEKENPTKQDCEVTAFYRLADRLKCRFPRLPIALLMDGMFAGGPTFSKCEEYGWRFIVVLKDKDIPALNTEFRKVVQSKLNNYLTFRTGEANSIKQEFVWANSIEYCDSNKQSHSLSVCECLETKPDNKGQLTTTLWRWVTDFEVKKNNVLELANNGGRIRWKIENEGFNVQKNQFELEHGYSQNPTAAKIFYLLLQIAHIIFQLVDKGSLLRRLFPSGFGSAKNLAFRLLEAWRNSIVTIRLLETIRQTRLRIIFDTS